jgi:hypothetical protein
LRMVIPDQISSAAKDIGAESVKARVAEAIPWRVGRVWQSVRSGFIIAKIN